MSPRTDAELTTGSHAPAALAMLLAVLFVLAVPWLFIRFSERRAAPASAPTADARAGERVYQRNCIACHEARGEGRPGKYPPLVGASWLLDDKETPIRIALLGVSGPMDVGGRRYDNLMPNFGVNLTDEALASVLTYARASWGNAGSPITPDDVAKVRASLAGETAVWSGGAALLEAKKTTVLP